MNFEVAILQFFKVAGHPLAQLKNFLRKDCSHKINRDPTELQMQLCVHCKRN